MSRVHGDLRICYVVNKVMVLTSYRTSRALGRHPRAWSRVLVGRVSCGRAITTASNGVDIRRTRNIGIIAHIDAVREAQHALYVHQY